MFFGDVVAKIKEAIENVKKSNGGKFDPIVQEFLDKAKFAGETIKQLTQTARDALHKGVELLIHGSNSILDSVKAILNKNKARSFAVTATLVATAQCTIEQLEEHQNVLDKAPFLLLLVTATNMNLNVSNTQANKHPGGMGTCEAIDEGYKYATNFLENCVESDNSIFKDAARLLTNTRGIVNRYCSDEEYRKQVLECALCAIQEKIECFRKHAEELTKHIYDEITQKRRAQNGEDLVKICCVVQSIGHCTKNITKTESCEQHTEFDQELEANLTKTVDDFCDPHKGSMSCDQNNKKESKFGNLFRSDAATAHSLITLSMTTVVLNVIQIV